MNMEEGKQRGVTNIEEGKQRGVTSTGYPPQPGIAEYPPQQPIGSFHVVEDYPSKPVTGPGPGYPFSEAVQPDRLFCWGLGVGWFLFILGFILCIIPWYVGAIMLFCVKRKHYKREKPGYIACAIFAVIGTVAIIIVIVTRPYAKSEC